MANSGSSANLLMVAALFFIQSIDLKRGDEVIVPSVSGQRPMLHLQQYGLKLKFVDIDIDTLNIDINKLKAAISVETKAIFTVNLLGNPNDFNELKIILVKTTIFYHRR